MKTERDKDKQNTAVINQNYKLEQPDDSRDSAKKKKLKQQPVQKRNGDDRKARKSRFPKN